MACLGRALCALFALGSLAALVALFTGIPGILLPRLGHLLTNHTRESTVAGAGSHHRGADALDPDAASWAQHQKEQREGERLALEREAGARHQTVRRYASRSA